MSAAETQAVWTEVKPVTQWRREASEGYVTVTHGVGDDKQDEFWVATFEPGGDEAGPRQTAEVFPSLEAAKDEGDRIVREPWDFAPARAI